MSINDDVMAAMQRAEAAMNPNLFSPDFIDVLKKRSEFALSLILIFGSLTLTRILMTHGYFEDDPDTAQSFIAECDKFATALNEGQPLDAQLASFFTKGMKA